MNWREVLMHLINYQHKYEVSEESTNHVLISSGQKLKMFNFELPSVNWQSVSLHWKACILTLHSAGGLSWDLPCFQQQVTWPTRNDKILDYCYCTTEGAYRAFLRAPLGKSDQAMEFLIPAYGQRLKTSKPTKAVVNSWSNDAIETFKACLDCADWAVSKAAC